MSHVRSVSAWEVHQLPAWSVHIPGEDTLRVLRETFSTQRMEHPLHRLFSFQVTGYTRTQTSWTPSACTKRTRYRRSRRIRAYTSQFGPREVNPPTSARTVAASTCARPAWSGICGWSAARHPSISARSARAGSSTNTTWRRTWSSTARSRSTIAICAWRNSTGGTSWWSTRRSCTKSSRPRDRRRRAWLFSSSGFLYFITNAYYYSSLPTSTRLALDSFAIRGPKHLHL